MVLIFSLFLSLSYFLFLSLSLSYFLFLFLSLTYTNSNTHTHIYTHTHIVDNDMWIGLGVFVAIQVFFLILWSTLSPNILSPKTVYNYKNKDDIMVEINFPSCKPRAGSPWGLLFMLCNSGIMIYMTYLGLHFFAQFIFTQKFLRSYVIMIIIYYYYHTNIIIIL